MDLGVFPEYSLHALSMSVDPQLICRPDGPEVAAFAQACGANRIWGCFPIMEFNPAHKSHNSGSIIDDAGELQLYHRKLHPWVPVEPSEPGSFGVPVCDGPKGAKIGFIICHDGMFPEMAREASLERLRNPAAYCRLHGADPTRLEDKQPSQRLQQTDGRRECLHVRHRRQVQLNGEAMMCDFDGTIVVEGGGVPDEIATAKVPSDLNSEARAEWGVGNNIYQLGHRCFAAVAGGARDGPYTFMRDSAAEKYRLPSENEVRVTEGTSCGLAIPERVCPEGHHG